jgi:hypothetical protein
LAGQVNTSGGGAAAIVIAQEELVVPLESVTLTEKLPAAVGVPVIAPVAVLRVMPAGRAPEVSENVYGGRPPLATAVDE